jgi:2,4-dienoyl-CoA reductase-like NADH-dependent reductase (Old Yellow Enzyme family)
MSHDITHAFTLPNGNRLVNRLAKSAMSERVATPSGAPSQGHVALYDAWSRGGAGLLITGNVMIDRHAIGETGNVIVEDDRDLPALARWAEAGTQNDTQLWMQLNHPGRQSPRQVSPKPVAPSAVRLRGAGPMFATPRALLSEEIEAIVKRFAASAQLAERAGFSGVQIHGAHGYLVSQFLSPRTNLRDDAWGGDAERRRRFLLEVVRAVREAVSPSFAVGLKLNSADFQRGGFDESESMAVLEALDGEGLDLLEISGGTYESAAMFEETQPVHDSSKKREAFFLDYAAKVRSSVKTPLMVTGGFRSTAGMNEALGSGALDVIGVARPLAYEPSLPRRLLTDPDAAAHPVKLATGIKDLDALIQGAWYQAQLERLAKGLATDASYSRFSAVAKYLLPRHRFASIEGAGSSASVARAA